jgi:hypothetical protein
MRTKIKNRAAAALLLLAVAVSGATPAAKAADAVPANKAVPPGTGTKLFVRAARPEAGPAPARAGGGSPNVRAAALAVANQLAVTERW